MSDREEREEHIKRLEAALACEEKQFSGKCSKAECDDNCALLYEQGNWGEWKDTLRYAINSLRTDLKYDLLYEETIEQADKQADKPTTKNDLGVDKEQLKAMIRGLTKWYVKRDSTEVGAPNTAVGLLYDDVMFGIDRLTSVTPQEPKSEWEQDHAILKAYSDGADEVLDKIRAEIENDWQLKKYPSSPFSCGLRRAIEIIDKYKAESEE